MRLAPEIHGMPVASSRPRGKTTLIYAVLVDDISQFADLATKYGAARNEFLISLKQQKRLLLEATFGERGCLMLIEAESVTDALTVVQGDPYIVEPVSNKVIIRSLDINVLGDTELLFRNIAAGKERP